MLDVGEKWNEQNVHEKNLLPQSDSVMFECVAPSFMNTLEKKGR